MQQRGPDNRNGQRSAPGCARCPARRLPGRRRARWFGVESGPKRGVSAGDGGPLRHANTPLPAGMNRTPLAASTAYPNLRRTARRGGRAVRLPCGGRWQSWSGNRTWTFRFRSPCCCLRQPRSQRHQTSRRRMAQRRYSSPSRGRRSPARPSSARSVSRGSRRAPTRWWSRSGSWGARSKAREVRSSRWHCLSR